METLLTRITLLLFCFAAANALPNLVHLPAGEQHSALRTKRKAQDISTSVIEYMETLRSQLSDEDGKPKFSNSDDPTEVWAVQDYDILHKGYRNKPKSSERCTAMNRFFFDWASVSESLKHKVLPVGKAILRAYLKVIPRLLNPHSPIPVSVDIYMKRQGSNDTSLGVLARQFQISATAESAGWIEMDVSSGVRVLWPVTSDDSRLEITVILRTDCRVSRKVPVIFEDPSTISLHQLRRRQRLYAFQPIFLVYISDEAVKDEVRKETLASLNSHKYYNDDVSNLEEENRNRQRRQANYQPCRVEDFEVVFGDLNLDYILAPHSYNARQCSGSCSHQTITTNGALANNHAKIMASAAVLSQLKPGKFVKEPKVPCCVPSKYSSMTLIIPNVKQGGIKYVVYSHMIVTECKCR